MEIVHINKGRCLGELNRPLEELAAYRIAIPYALIEMRRSVLDWIEQVSPMVHPIPFHIAGTLTQA